MDTQNLTARLATQRAAFEREGAPPHGERTRQLLRLKQAVLARRAGLADAVAADFGHRTAYETLLLEIVPVVHGVDYLRRHLRRWMRPERRRVAVHFQPGRAQVIYQPLGVVGIISPWNYPLSLALMPLATAIAAGNRVMLKPSELTPATNAVLADVLRGVFTEEQVTVVSGDVEVGRAFAALPFDHLVFTGSTDVGRHVMRAASEHLVPVMLELGGKSPAIVQQGIPLAGPAASIAFGKLVNAGQTCIAPDYALVHEADVAPFVAAYTAAVRRLYPGGTADPAYSSIIDARHCARLSALLEDARSKGAEIREIDSAARHPEARARTLPPTLVLRTTPDMTISQQEIFGPILPVVSCRDLDDAIAYVNARPHPLALYLFCRDARVRRSVLERTRSGNVTINDTLMHFGQDDLPFGGVGASGMGAYHGREGFLALSHARGVFEESPRWSTSRLTHPPFGRLTDALLRYLLR